MLTTTRIRSIALSLLATAAISACQPSSPADQATSALGLSAQALSEQSENGKKGQQGKDASTCLVTPGSNGNTMISGIVLAPDEVLYNGHVLYDAQGVIQCVGKQCDKLPEAADATRIDCHKGVISPGLINGHDHITYQDLPYAFTPERYEHRNEWRSGLNGHTRIVTPGGATAAQIQWAELRQVMSGTTAVNGSGDGAGLLRNVDRSAAKNFDLFADGAQVLYDTFPLGSDAMETQGCAIYSFAQDAATLANAAAYAPHVSEGIAATAQNEFRCLSGQSRYALDVLGPKMSIIHGVGLNAFDVAAMRASGTRLVWSPRTNVALYGDTAQIPVFKALGVKVALGTDWLRSGSMNMLRELSCADELNATYFNHALTSKDLWEMATANAADAMGAGDKLGRLAPGHLADLAVYTVRELDENPHRAVITAQPGDVVLTMRGGKVLYGDAALVEALVGGCDTLDVCGAPKAVCLTGEQTPSLALLQQANASAYPLFACGTPASEPTCVPERSVVNASYPSSSVNGSTLYSGEPQATDVDGDGLLDEQDNCPAVFNPVRPMDNGQQADFDHDGVGDACDACPVAAGVEACSAAVLADVDQDGTPNDQDTCRFLANADQADQDADGKGDVCDACPAFANPGFAACPPELHTIYELKSGQVSAGVTSKLENLIVTGAVSNGVFVQMHETDPRYQGPENSGVFVFTNRLARPAVGSRVNVVGKVGYYQGQMQLNPTEPLTVLSTGNAAPKAVLVGPGEINDAGARSKALEGVLVQVQNVTVTSLEPFREFYVADGAGISVLVDDSIYFYALPTVGTTYRAVTGVLALRNYHFKIEVRNAADLLK